MQRKPKGSKNGCNPPVQRNAANARERARMRILSSAFGMLKTKLPNIPPDTKLSKLDTLRLATMYIKQLKTLVENGNGNGGGSGSGSGSAPLAGSAAAVDGCHSGLRSNENVLAGFEMDDHGAIYALQPATQSMTWPFTFHNTQTHSTSRQLQFQYSTMDWSANNQQHSHTHGDEQHLKYTHAHHNAHNDSNNSSNSSGSSVGSSSNGSGIGAGNITNANSHANNHATTNNHSGFRQTTYTPHTHTPCSSSNNGDINPWCDMDVAHAISPATASPSTSCTYMHSSTNIVDNRLHYVEAAQHQ